MRSNHRLPPAIRILDAQEVSEDFHALSATAKTYDYRIYRGEISLALRPAHRLPTCRIRSTSRQ
ncbi:MAG: hypothetical protein R2748_13385 [Bryobacterales bacterium]